MRRKKNIGTGLISLVVFLIAFTVFSAVFDSKTAFALTDAQIQQKALVECAKDYGVTSKDYAQFQKNDPGKTCISTFIIIYKDSSQATFDSVCSGKVGISQSGCLIGRTLGKKSREADQPTGGGGGGGGTNLSDATIRSIADSDPACQVGSKELKACLC
jgi:hypothetical protein